MTTDQMQARAQHKGNEPLHEFKRRHHEVARAVANGPVTSAQLLPSEPIAILVLSEWMLALLALMLFGFGAQRVRKTR